MARPYIPHDPDYRGSEELDRPLRPLRVTEACQLLELATEAMKLGDACESPIEVMLGAEIMVRLEPLFRIRGFELVAQFPLNPYRFDFAIRIGQATKPALLIECDGAAFHTSPEQVQHDRRKDQWASLHGFKVVRFTGSDIHSRPRECIEAIRKAIPE